MSKRFLVTLLIVFWVFPLAFIAYVSQCPNVDLHFSREVISELPPERLQRSFSVFQRWPQWFYSLAQASMIHSSSSANLEVIPGSMVDLRFDPKKGPYKRFDLKVKVIEYSPQRMKLQVLEDTSGRLTRLFDRLDWEIELVPRGRGSLIRGTATAHTAHWKARLFGKISEKILMNQVFYPNLVKLADLKQPFSTDSTLQGMRPSSTFAP